MTVVIINDEYASIFEKSEDHKKNCRKINSVTSLFHKILHKTYSYCTKRPIRLINQCCAELCVNKKAVYYKLKLRKV